MTAHGTNTRDVQALVYLTRRLREETYGARQWDEAGVAVKLGELVGQNLASVVERVLCHATDPEAKTPGALSRPFLPPKPSERPKGHPHPPTMAEACRRCGQAQPCHCTREDRAVTYGNAQPRDDDERMTKADALARMRADIGAARVGGGEVGDE